MSKGPFEHLNIYLQYGLRKLGFKNTILHRPLFDPENFYYAWMVDGGWMDAIIFLLFFFFILLWDIAHDIMSLVRTLVRVSRYLFQNTKVPFWRKKDPFYRKKVPF